MDGEQTFDEEIKKYEDEEGDDNGLQATPERFGIEKESMGEEYQRKMRERAEQKTRQIEQGDDDAEIEK